MSKPTFTPIVPAELEPLWDDHAQEAHSRLAATTLNQFRQDIPQARYFGSDFALCYDLPPKNDQGVVIEHDQTEAVAVRLPYLNAYRVHMHIRAKTIQAMLPRPMRLIVFPDTGPNVTAYMVDRKEQHRISKGDNSPITNRQSHTLERLKIGLVHNIDYSRGAAIGARFIKTNLEDPNLGAFRIGASGEFEPVNCVDRGVARLELDFFSTKSKDFNGDIKGSAIPALEEALHVGGPINSAVQSADIAGLWLYSWWNKLARAGKQGMATSKFVTDIEAIRRQPDAPNILVAGGSESAIFPLEVQRQLGALTLEGFKHTMGDNVVLHALLARKAIFGS